MSNDDPTKRIDDSEVKYETTPGVTAILERINQVGESLRVEMNQRFDALEQNLTPQIDAVRTDLAEFRKETQSRLQEIDGQTRLMNRMFEIVSKELLEVKAHVRVAEDRLDGLERKAS